MDFKKYYSDNETFHTDLNHRLDLIIKYVLFYKPKSVLDVGCGGGLLINEMQKTHKAKYSGVDVYKNKNLKNVDYKSADITKGLPFEDNKFDLVTFGEVIEHVPNPDFILAEIHRVLKPKGIVIVTTPNLASWANRILLLIGIQPLFTETSSELNLGRRLKVLGQKGKVQGHLKVFTSRSLQEILEYKNFDVIERKGTIFFFPFPLSLWDRLMKNFVSLSSGLIYVGQKRK